MLDFNGYYEVGGYKKAGLDVDYAIRTTQEGSVQVFFQQSASKKDWEINFDFAVAPYKNMEETWLAHRGFVRAWKSAQDVVIGEILACKGRDVEVYGYSLGGAMAQLCLEDLLFRGIAACGKTWASPKVFWLPPKKLQERMKQLINVRHRRDIVTKVPFWPFRAVGFIREFGNWGIPWFSCHFPGKYSGF